MKRNLFLMCNLHLLYPFILNIYSHKIIQLFLSWPIRKFSIYNSKWTDVLESIKLRDVFFFIILCCSTRLKQKSMEEWDIICIVIKVSERESILEMNSSDKIEETQVEHHYNLNNLG